MTAAKTIVRLAVLVDRTDINQTASAPLMFTVETTASAEAVAGLLRRELSQKAEAVLATLTDAG